MSQEGSGILGLLKTSCATRRTKKCSVKKRDGGSTSHAAKASHGYAAPGSSGFQIP